MKGGMEMVYSVDLKQRVIELSEEGMQRTEIAKVLGVARSSLYRWLNQHQQGESLEVKKRKSFYRKLDVKKLQAYVERHPDKTLRELQEQFGCSCSGIWYRLKQLKITLKKKSCVIENAIQRSEPSSLNS
jgi:transposase